MKKFISRALMLLCFCLALLVMFMMNPSLLYAHKTTCNNLIIYHNSELDEELTQIIDLSLEAIKKSEIFVDEFASDLCLNEGLYPKLVRRVLGDDVFTAFANKVVVLGQPHEQFDRFEKWGVKMKWSQFLSHALVHNLQFNHHGVWDANPLGGHPNWKWEGYVEYIVLGKLTSLEELVAIGRDASLTDYEWINLTESEGTLKIHLQYLALVKYCFEVQGWTYEELMETQISEDVLLQAVVDYVGKNS